MNHRGEWTINDCAERPCITDIGHMDRHIVTTLKMAQIRAATGGEIVDRNYAMTVVDQMVTDM